MKRPRLLLNVATGALLALYPISLQAQEHGATPATAQSATQPAATEGPDRHGPEHGANEHGTTAHDATAHDATAHDATAHEATAHAGTAHEGAEHAGSHHPVIKLGPWVLNEQWQFIIKLINFAIFAGGIIFLTKGALSAAFKARTKELEDRLSQAQKDKAEGEAQMQALEAKMAGLQAELDGILQKAEVDSEAEKQRILEGARLEAASILAQTKTEIENQRKASETQLRSLVAELATEGAAKKLQAHLQGGAASSTVDRAIQQIGGLQ